MESQFFSATATARSSHSASCNLCRPLGSGDELVALADTNGDGKLDIVKATQNHMINVALGNGDGNLSAGSGISDSFDPQYAIGRGGRF